MRQKRDSNPQKRKTISRIRDYLGNAVYKNTASYRSKQHPDNWMFAIRDQLEVQMPDTYQAVVSQ